jgi:hypothetical protein
MVSELVPAGTLDVVNHNIFGILVIDVPNVAFVVFHAICIGLPGWYVDWSGKTETLQVGGTSPMVSVSEHVALLVVPFAIRVKLYGPFGVFAGIVND